MSRLVRALSARGSLRRSESRSPSKSRKEEATQAASAPPESTEEDVDLLLELSSGATTSEKPLPFIAEKRPRTGIVPEKKEVTPAQEEEEENHLASLVSLSSATEEQVLPDFATLQRAVLPGAIPSSEEEHSDLAPKAHLYQLENHKTVDLTPLMQHLPRGDKMEEERGYSSYQVLFTECVDTFRQDPALASFALQFNTSAPARAETKLQSGLTDKKEDLMALAALRRAHRPPQAAREEPIKSPISEESAVLQAKAGRRGWAKGAKNALVPPLFPLL